MAILMSIAMAVAMSKFKIKKISRIAISVKL
jgi:hypothetical protein